MSPIHVGCVTMLRTSATTPAVGNGPGRLLDRFPASPCVLPTPRSLNELY